MVAGTALSPEIEQAIDMASDDYKRSLREEAKKGTFGRVIHETYLRAGDVTSFEATVRRQTKLK